MILKKKNNYIFFIIFFLSTVLNGKNQDQKNKPEKKIIVSDDELYDLIRNDRIKEYDDTFKISELENKNSLKENKHTKINKKIKSEEIKPLRSIFNYQRKYFSLNLSPRRKISKDDLKKKLYSEKNPVLLTSSKTLWIYNDQNNKILEGILDVPILLQKKFKEIKMAFSQLRADLKIDQPSEILDKLNFTLKKFIEKKNDDNFLNLKNTDQVLETVGFDTNEKNIEILKFNAQKKLNKNKEDGENQKKENIKNDLKVSDQVKNEEIIISDNEENLKIKEKKDLEKKKEEFKNQKNHSNKKKHKKHHKKKHKNLKKNKKIKLLAQSKNKKIQSLAQLKNKKIKLLAKSKNKKKSNQNLIIQKMFKQLTKSVFKDEKVRQNFKKYFSKKVSKKKKITKKDFKDTVKLFLEKKNLDNSQLATVKEIHSKNLKDNNIQKLYKLFKTNKKKKLFKDLKDLLLDKLISMTRKQISKENILRVDNKIKHVDGEIYEQKKKLIKEYIENLKKSDFINKKKIEVFEKMILNHDHYLLSDHDKEDCPIIYISKQILEIDDGEIKEDDKKIDREEE